MYRPPLGQHFLTDDAVLAQVLECIKPQAQDTFVEVGPGSGCLTIPLVASGATVYAIERDRRLATTLAACLAAGDGCCEITIGDAVHGLPIPAAGAWRLVGNIPYSISSPLLAGLVPVSDRMIDGHLMLQREFALRLGAQPGSRTYGRLSVGMQAHFAIEIVLAVSSLAFTPPPQVESSLVRIVPQVASRRITDLSLFDELVQRAFNQRRKKLGTALGSWAVLLDEGMAQLRAEALSVEDYIVLANRLAARRSTP